jgi:hypothetical protein
MAPEKGIAHGAKRATSGASAFAQRASADRWRQQKAERMAHGAWRQKSFAPCRVFALDTPERLCKGGEDRWIVPKRLLFWVFSFASPVVTRKRAPYIVPALQRFQEDLHSTTTTALGSPLEA